MKQKVSRDTKKAYGGKEELKAKGYRHNAGWQANKGGEVERYGKRRMGKPAGTALLLNNHQKISNQI